MRILICGDLHYRGTSPVARTDDFQAALDTKLDEVFMLAHAKGVDAIIQTGDLFDSHSPSFSVVSQLARVIKDGKTVAQVPFYTVAGNHDIVGSNPETVDRCALGLLNRLSIVRLLDMEVTVDGITLTGQPYTSDVDHNPDAYTGANWSDTEVHVVHGMLLAEPQPHYDHVLIEDVAPKTQADVVITGHAHHGYGVVQSHGTTFISPGALCRIRGLVSEMERQVQVALLEVDGSGVVDVELIPIAAAAPGDEVLSREHLQQQQERDERLSEFLNLLEDSGEKRMLQARELIRSLAAEKEMDDAVVDEAYRYLGQAEEVVG